MALNPLVDNRDLNFNLFELLDSESLLKLEGFKDFDRETFDATLQLAEQIAVEKFYPASGPGDREGATFNPDNAEVKVPKAYHEAWQAYVEAGFPGLICPQKHGGMGMPETVWKACLETIMAGCVPLGMYSTLTIGSAMLISKYGCAISKERYLEKMVSGEWGGTMCLTENVAGSDVGALKTKAVKQSDGTYRITGQKIFISGGDHDLCDNIVHAVLARVDGDPEGTKGISIFAVPKFRVNSDGSMGQANDVVCAGIEHKMGLKGSATCTLQFGDKGECEGYLLGEERQGMKIMFDMMNAARLEVAVHGLATSSTAYLHALNYAKGRVQGKDPANKKGSDVAIIEHADVKRMLLKMKSQVEAMRTLTYVSSLQMDYADHGEGALKDKGQKILDFLIPILKAGNTDNVWDLTAEAIQVHGGYGFCSEYPVEQMARDSKIFSLYEGTNGIQSIDLMMRKLLMNKDQEIYKAFKGYMEETLAPYKDVIPKKYLTNLDRAIGEMDETIGMLGGYLQKGQLHKAMANAVPLQLAFKILCYTWTHTWSLGITIPKVKELVGEVAPEELRKKLADSEDAAYYYGRKASAEYYLENEFHQLFSHLHHVRSGFDGVWQAVPEMFSGAME